MIHLDLCKKRPAVTLDCPILKTLAATNHCLTSSDNAILSCLPANHGHRDLWRASEGSACGQAAQALQGTQVWHPVSVLSALHPRSRCIQLTCVIFLSGPIKTLRTRLSSKSQIGYSTISRTGVSPTAMALSTLGWELLAGRPTAALVMKLCRIALATSAMSGFRYRPSILATSALS